MNRIESLKENLDGKEFRQIVVMQKGKMNFSFNTTNSIKVTDTHIEVKGTFCFANFPIEDVTELSIVGKQVWVWCGDTVILFGD